jgi:hypothetical protein
MIANAISIPDQKDQEKKYKILKQIILGSHVVNLVIKKSHPPRRMGMVEVGFVPELL